MGKCDPESKHKVVNRKSSEIIQTMELTDKNTETAIDVMFTERVNMWVNGWGILAGKWTL